MLPVKDVLEAYTTKSRQYSYMFKEIENKIFYVPTSIYPSTPIPVENHHLLDKYDILEDSLKICFIGRHNVIKGYDKLQEIAKKFG